MGARTTTRGVCRICEHEWAVPRTSVEPENFRQLDNGVTVVLGLDPCCPSCESVRISWLTDDAHASAQVVESRGKSQLRTNPSSTQAVLDQILARLRANPRRTMRPGGPAN